MKENLEDFYIPYRKTLDLPKNVTFGLEVEFKMDSFNDSYKSNFIDEDNAARVFMKDIGYDYNYDVECEINDHIELVSPVLTDNDKTWEELENNEIIICTPTDFWVTTRCLKEIIRPIVSVIR